MSLLSAIFNRAESILFFIVFFGLHYCILKYILSKPYINSFPVISFFCILFIGFFVSVIFVVGWMRCSHHITSFRNRMIANITNHWWIKAILSNEYGFFIVAVSAQKLKKLLRLRFRPSCLHRWILLNQCLRMEHKRLTPIIWLRLFLK